jgi:hypothetical protein
MNYVALLDIRAHLLRQVEPFTATCEGCDHATGEASFEADAYTESRRRDGTGCGWTGSFSGGERIGVYNTHC